MDGAISEVNAHGVVYEGSIPGAFGDRKPPSSAYATLSPIFHMDKKGLFTGGNFWDGRATAPRLGNPAAPNRLLAPSLNPAETGSVHTCGRGHKGLCRRLRRSLQAGLGQIGL